MMKGCLRDLSANKILNGSIQDVIDRLVTLRATLVQEGGEIITLHYVDGVQFGYDPELYITYSKEEAT